MEARSYQKVRPVDGARPFLTRLVHLLVAAFGMVILSLVTFEFLYMQHFHYACRRYEKDG